jgi:hypothetical protein
MVRIDIEINTNIKLVKFNFLNINDPSFLYLFSETYDRACKKRNKYITNTEDGATDSEAAPRTRKSNQKSGDLVQLLDVPEGTILQGN